MNAYELFNGAWKSRNVEQNMREAADLLGDLDILPLDTEAAFHVSRIHAALGRRGEAIGLEDEFIAGIALRHAEALVTRNGAHFGRVPGLRVEEW